MFYSYMKRQTLQTLNNLLLIGYFLFKKQKYKNHYIKIDNPNYVFCPNFISCQYTD